MKKVWYRKNVGKAMGLFLCLTLGVSAVPGASTKAAEDTALYVGDVDGDGSVTPKDVTKLRRYLAGGWDVEVDVADADVDSDGSITPKDVTKLRRYLAGGWGVELPLKQVVAHKGSFDASSGSAYYHLEEFGTNGKLLKSRNYYSYPDSSGVSVYSYDTKGHSSYVFKGMKDEDLYDANDSFVGYLTSFSDKTVSRTDYTTEIKGTVTYRTRTVKAWDGIVTRIYVDEYDNTFKNNDNSYGRRLKYTVENKNGKVLYYTEYHYATDGRVCENVYYDGAGNKTGSEEITWSADNKTRTVTDKDENGKVAGINIYEYDDKGKTVKQISKNDKEEIKNTYEYTYFANGNRKSEIRKNADGELIYYKEYDSKNREIKYQSSTSRKYVNTYNDAANTVTITRYQYDYNNKVFIESFVYEYFFDEDTNTMQVKVLDKPSGIIHYETYEYDDNAYLVKETYLDADKKVAYTTEYTYDSVGLLTKSVEKDEAQTITGYTTYKYNEYGSIVETDYYNSEGVVYSSNTVEYHANGEEKINKSINSDGSYSYDEYDEDGRYLGYGYVDSEGVKYSYVEYVRDEDGNEIKRIEYYNNIKTITAFDKGNKTETITYDSNDAVTSKTVYEYNAKGLAKETETDKDGKIVSVSTYTRDDDGNELTCVCEYADGTKDTRSYEYFEDGETSKAVYTYADGSKGETTYWESGKHYAKTSYSLDSDGSSSNYEYDEEGRTLLSVSKDKDGKETSKSVYKYDDNGNQILYVYYSDGVESNRTEYKYHENGELAEYVETYASGIKYVYKYTDFGEEEAYIVYDDEGKETNSRISTYDENKKIKSKIVKDTWSSSETEYENGLIIKQVNKDDEGHKTGEWLDYSYDGEKLLGYTYNYYYYDTDSQEEKVDSSTKYTYEYYDSGNRKSDTELSYDNKHVTNYADNKNQNVISDIYYDTDGNITSSTKYEYNSKGRLIKQEEVFSDGSSYLYEYEYDGDIWNDWIVLKKSTSKDSYSTTVTICTYDDYGREIRREYSYTSTDDSSQNLYYVEENEYNDNGNMTHYKKTDDNGSELEIFYADDSYNYSKKIEINAFGGYSYSSVDIPFRKSSQNYYLTEYYTGSDLSENPENIKYTKVIVNYDEDGYYHDAEFYTMTEDKTETKVLTATQEFDNEGNVTKVIYTYTDNRIKEWYFDEDGQQIYEVHLKADGTIEYEYPEQSSSQDSDE